MNHKHWEKFYQDKKAPKGPTDFAKFCDQWIEKNLDQKKQIRLIDLGAGSGRDTYFFTALEYKTTALDYASTRTHKNLIPNLEWVKLDICDAVKQVKSEFDIVYSRFFLHAIRQDQVFKIFKWTDGIFMAEFRVVGDKPKIYKDHDRTLFNPTSLLELMISKYNFEILYFKVGRGMAVYKSEDPLICRVIAKK